MRRLAAFAMLPCLAACDAEQSMYRQAKLTPLAPAAAMPGGVEAQAPPPGVVDQGATARLAAAATPPPVTPALVARGRDRHRIFCAPCHGDAGAGDGAVVRRGFPPPLPYTHPTLRAAPAAELYAAIANGYGAMYPQAERVAPADRWAIVAYIRALQRAGQGAGQGPAA